MNGLTASLGNLSQSSRKLAMRKAPTLLLLFVAAGAFIGHQRAPYHPVVAFQQDSASVTLKWREDMKNVIVLVEERATKLRRAQTIAGFARRYGIGQRLANDIYVAAEKARVDPDLAYRLVRLESDFDERATSPVGAIGLTQVMLTTAQEWNASLTAEQLYDRKLNLRIGLRYLRAMLDEHDGEVMHALAAYNRGPGTVQKLLAQGQLTSSAYERVIMKGYSGRGVLD